MNLYLLVEGITEQKVYPGWLSHMLPSLSRVHLAQEATTNNYYLISGLGYPRLLDVTLVDAVEEINELGNYDYLVLAIDADTMSEQEKVAEIEQFIKNNAIVLTPRCRLQIIAQKSCMETWFLGNKKAYAQNVGRHSDFYHHAKFYNVSQQDPELMGKPTSFAKSVSIYHEAYLRAMLAEKNIRYSKNNPQEVVEKHYLEQLLNRVYETAHLTSLLNFFRFCESISV